MPADLFSTSSDLLVAKQRKDASLMQRRKFLVWGLNKHLYFWKCIKIKYLNCSSQQHSAECKFYGDFQEGYCHKSRPWTLLHTTQSVTDHSRTTFPIIHCTNTAVCTDHAHTCKQSPNHHHPITHTHTHYISPGHSPIHCRVLLASLPTKRFP